MLTVGSLFSGIGGIDLGLERTGHFKTIWFSEIDKYANRVLAKHWPDVPNLGNIKEIDFERIQRPDVVVGGYPCQPFSTAGKRGGETDPRHLWPECLRALRALRPRYALFENVRGHLSLGFARVLSDLASIGFDAEWQIIPASSVGAPHRRDRIFIVAYPSSEYGYGVNDYTRNSVGSEKTTQLGNDRGSKAVAYPNHAGSGTPQRRMDGCGSQEVFDRDDAQHESCRCRADVASPSSEQSNVGQPRGDYEQCDKQGLQTQVGASGADVADSEVLRLESRGYSSNKRNTQPGHGIARNDSREGTFGDWWQVEPDVGRVANGVSSRVDRLRALGNAVVPQVAEMIGYMIAEHANA